MYSMYHAPKTSHLIGFPAVSAIAPLACDTVVEGDEAASGGKVRGRRASTVEVAASTATSDKIHQLRSLLSEENMRDGQQAEKGCANPDPQL